MRGIEPPREEAEGRLAVLVRYRVFGGPVAVDQRLTVFEDGAVKLDERHRSRAPIWLRLEPSELEAVRAGIEQLTTGRWSHAPSLARRALRGLARALLAWLPGGHRTGTRFELKRDRGAIVGKTDDPSVPAVVELLDTLRVDAVRSQTR